MKRISPKIEQRLLVCCLQTDDVTVQRYILGQTDLDDFATDEGRQVRKLIEDFVRMGKPVGKADVFAESPALSPKSKIFITSTPKIRQVASRASLKTIDSLLSTLKDLRKSRNLLDSVQKIAEIGKGEVSDETLGEARVLVEKAYRDLSLDQAVKNPLIIGPDMTEDDIRDIVKKTTTPDERVIIPTGLSGLDTEITGFKRGDLAVLSAQRGGCKTAVALQMAYTQFKAGYNVAFFSLEMPWEQLQGRLISHITGLASKTVRVQFRGLVQEERKNIRKDMYASLTQNLLKIAKEKNCYFVPFGPRNPKRAPFDIEMEMTTARCKFDVVFIDYITFLQAKAKDMFEQQIEIATYLKTMATKLDCVVVLLTQLNDDGHVKYGKGPEEAADWWLWWSFGETEKATGNVEIHLGKARHGETCIIPARFRMDIMNITTFPPNRASPVSAPTQTNVYETGGV
ncbi:MAG: DnaB-like helicase C-terminal domain-containing protein [Patescibacteria group bacterium]